MPEQFEPTLEAARARIAAVRPAAYARTRNALDGAVTGLSPYIAHGLVSLTDVLSGVAARHALDVQHKLVFELGWRAYYRHVWHHRGEGILQSLHQGLLPEAAYARALPPDIRQGCTGVPVIDEAVRTLYATGNLHNHARMWLASYVVHVRKVHWRAGADWMYSHLLDGDLASNHLSWQWVAGTGSKKPYLFNAENVALYAPPAWHSPRTVIDTSYAVLDHMARTAAILEGEPLLEAVHAAPKAPLSEPLLTSTPPDALGLAEPRAEGLANAVQGRDVWLVHPWSLGELPLGLAGNTLVIGVYLAEFHRAWPWSERRWNFVDRRMSKLATLRWFGDAAALAAALKGAARVRSTFEPHLAPWLAGLAQCEAAPALFPPVEARCDSFSQWWTRATRGLETAADLLAVNEVPAW